MKLVTATAFAVLLSACASTPAPQANATAEGGGRVCRSERVLGSNMPVRTCHTAAEWAALDGANQENSEQIARDIRQNNSVSGGR
jgi:ABC-type uncharacterized transport system auxiliary subunit